MLKKCLKFLWLMVLYIPPVMADIHFAVIGDYGNDSRAEEKVASRLKAAKPEFIITTGDNNYPSGCWSSIDTVIGKYYHSYIGNYQGKYGQGSVDNRFFPSIGNHDWRAITHCLPSNNRLPYRDYFTLPGDNLYYDFVKGPVHFFVLDSDVRQPDGNSIGSVQYQWFVQQVRASTAAFKVVYFHHPPYSSGRHGATSRMQWNFAEMGVDVVLSGHEHFYERIERDGVLYIINGAAGASLTSKRHSDPFSHRFYNSHHGFMMISASETSMRLIFINSNNEIRDERVIHKSY